MNTFWIRLDVFWGLSQDENYLPVCVQSRQFSCQATSAVAPVSLTLMIINDTLSLCTVVNFSGRQHQWPLHVMCALATTKKTCVFPWCCWEAAHLVLAGHSGHKQVTPVCSKQALTFPCDSFSLNVCFVSLDFKLFSEKGLTCPILGSFHVTHSKHHQQQKSRFPYVLIHSKNVCNSGYDTGVTESLPGQPLY